MPLIANENQTPSRAPWRGAVAALIGALVFVVSLAVVARATRDEAGGVVHHRVERVARVDAGQASSRSSSPSVDAGAAVADAGALTDGGSPEDAGALAADPADLEGFVGPQGEPATGPAVVAGPPIVAADVVAVVVPLVEECLKKSLRFDPSLGGRVLVRIVVGGGRLAPTLPVSPSPVLSSCIATGGSALAWPMTEGERHLVEAHLSLDGLRGAVRVDSAALVTVPD